MHTARKVSLQEWKYVPVSESRECQTALLALRQPLPLSLNPVPIYEKSIFEAEILCGVRRQSIDKVGWNEPPGSAATPREGCKSY
jgi:hypothetical protein